MTRPIALRSEAGVVYAYACGACHNVRSPASRPGKKHGPDADLVAMRERDAKRCCTCRVCEAAEDPRAFGWGFVCPACKPGEDAREQEQRERCAARDAADAAHLAESLKVALDEDAATRLRDLMSEISEECWCAGWMGGLEYSLWRVIENGPITYGRSDVSQSEVDELRRLHEKSGGWWFFHDEHGETFVPRAAWLDMLAEYQRGMEAEG